MLTQVTRGDEAGGRHQGRTINLPSSCWAAEQSSGLVLSLPSLAGQLGGLTLGFDEVLGSKPAHLRGFKKANRKSPAT